MSLEYTASDALPTGPVIEREAGGSGPLSPRDAARSLADTRYKEEAKAENPPEKQAPESAEPAAPVEQESALQADAGEAETPLPGESEAPEAEAALPPLDAPRSWTKEDKELFQSLPRETQERLVDRERSRERDFSRRQQDAAEKLKGLTAKEQAVEQARQRYEQSLPALLQTLQDAQAGDFADIKSVQDITALASADPFRFAQWQAHQMKVAAVQNQIDEANQRREQERQTKNAEFVKTQDALFLEKAPDMSDPKKAAEVANSAITMLKDLGFTDNELGDLWTGKSEISIRDHRLQLLIRDGVKYRDAQAAARKVSAAPKPPVQRPGVPAPRGGNIDAEIKTLTQQLDNSKGLEQIRIAARLKTLQSRSAQAR